MDTRLVGCLILCATVVAGCHQAPDTSVSPPTEAQQTLAAPTTAADCERLFEVLLNHPVCMAPGGQIHQQETHRMRNFDKMSPTRPMTTPPKLSFDAPPVTPRVP